MFTISHRRTLVPLAVAAGLLVAAGPASASPAEPLTTPPQPQSVLQTDFMRIDGFQGGCASTPTGDRSAIKSSKDHSSGNPANARAPLSYTLSDCMISG